MTPVCPMYAMMSYGLANGLMMDGGGISGMMRGGMMPWMMGIGLFLGIAIQISLLVALIMASIYLARLINRVRAKR
ncbi:MAG: hypothetical protein ACRDFQ_04860 [Anaerolineales bacterium]